MIQITNISQVMINNTGVIHPEYIYQAPTIKQHQPEINDINLKS